MDGFQESINTRPERLAKQQELLNSLEEEMKNNGINALLKQPIKFGKHKGKEYFMLPKSYVQWMISQNMLQDDMIQALKVYEKREALERSISHLMRDGYD